MQFGVDTEQSERNKKVLEELRATEKKEPLYWWEQGNWEKENPFKVRKEREATQ